MLIAGLLLILAGLWLAYAAGRDAADRERWQAQAARQYEAALAQSRTRHPSMVDPSIKKPIR